MRRTSYFTTLQLRRIGARLCDIPRSLESNANNRVFKLAEEVACVWNSVYIFDSGKNDWVNSLSSEGTSQHVVCAYETTTGNAIKHGVIVQMVYWCEGSWLARIEWHSLNEPILWRVTQSYGTIIINRNKKVRAHVGKATIRARQQFPSGIAVVYREANGNGAQFIYLRVPYSHIV